MIWTSRSVVVEFTKDVESDRKANKIDAHDKIDGPRDLKSKASSV